MQFLEHQSYQEYVLINFLWGYLVTHHECWFPVKYLEFMSHTSQNRVNLLKEYLQSLSLYLSFFLSLSLSPSELFVLNERWQWPVGTDGRGLKGALMISGCVPIPSLCYMGYFQCVSLVPRGVKCPLCECKFAWCPAVVDVWPVLGLLWLFAVVVANHFAMVLYRHAERIRPPRLTQMSSGA